MTNKTLQVRMEIKIKWNKDKYKVGIKINQGK